MRIEHMIREDECNNYFIDSVFQQILPTTSIEKV